MEKDNKFACAINCMDGRVQDAVKNYLKENYKVGYVDMVTEPGPNKILAENPSTRSSTEAHSKSSRQVIIENIKKRVEISVKRHGSKVIAIVGHFDCAGNPTEKEEQIQHLKSAKKIVDSFGFDAEIILLWVDGDWKTVEKIQ